MDQKTAQSLKIGSRVTLVKPLTRETFYGHLELVGKSFVVEGVESTSGKCICLKNLNPTTRRWWAPFECFEIDGQPTFGIE